MHKNVIISVKGNQQYKNNDDIIELVTEGKYYKKGKNYYLTYKETEITGMEGTTTTLKIEDEKVTLMRFGKDNNSQLVFEKYTKHLGYYETSYGGFTVGVFSNKLKIDVDDNGGEFTVDYLIEVDHVATGSNDLNVKIKEINETNDKCNGEYQMPN